MSYNAVKHLKPSEFKRLCGVHYETFEAMLSVLKQALVKQATRKTKQVKLGRPIVNDIGKWRENTGHISTRVNHGG